MYAILVTRMSWQWRLVILHLCLFGAARSLSSTQYYVTRSDIQKQMEPSTSVPKEVLHPANSNLFYIEEGGSHELAELEHEKQPYIGHYIAAEKKHSKYFTEEISFVIVVVTLAVFLCFLSSLIIPLTVLLLNGGLSFGGLNSILPAGGFGTIGAGLMGRRRRSLADHISRDESISHYMKRFDVALEKFEMKA